MRKTLASLRPPKIALAALAMAGLWLHSGPAAAGRTLKEAKSINGALKSAAASERAAALKAAGLEAQCTKAAQKSRDLDGVACRLAVFSHLSQKAPLSSEAALKRRVKAAEDARATADSIASYKPLHKKPTFDRERFEAHRQACRVVLDAYDAVKAMRPADKTLASASKAALGGPDDGLFKNACECARDTIGLTAGVGLSADEQGALQSVLTSRGCFLDKSKVSKDRGGPESSFSGRAGELAEASTDEAALLDYAKVRDIGLERCRAKALDARGQLTDKKELKRCACGEINRWSFPKKRGRPDMKVTVPLIKGKVGVEVEVTAPGKVKSCGPLAGPLAGG